MRTTRDSFAGETDGSVDALSGPLADHSDERTGNLNAAGEPCVLPFRNSKVEQCLAELRALRSTYGYSVYDAAQRRLNRERLMVRGRPEQKHWKASEYRRKYHEQKGRCGICEEAMVAPRIFPGRELEMAHLDAHTVEGYNDWKNVVLAHKGCNREDGAKSLLELSKGGRGTVAEMLEWGMCGAVGE